MAKNDLLKEAIADAKAVRETAIANAKLALEEAFTPKLQSMLSNKIQEEEDEDVSLVGDEGDATVSDVADDDSGLAQADEETEVQTSEPGEGGMEEGGDETDDTVHENEEEEEVVEGEDPTGASDSEPLDEEEEEEVEEDLELESIIKELEDEETNEEEEEIEESSDGMEGGSKNLPAASKNTGKKEMQEGEEEDELEEEFDLEEVINALKEDDEEEIEEGEKEEDELTAAYETIKYLKDKINEVNLLNAKLLFSNKLFRANNLNEGQKMKVIETFDRASSVREVKLVYTTLAESLTGYKKSRKRTVTEGFASKSTKSTKPKGQIVESNQFANRMKKLAGLL